MGNVHVPLCHDRHQVAVAQFVGEVPPDAQDNDDAIKVTALEQTGQIIVSTIHAVCLAVCTSSCTRTARLTVRTRAVTFNRGRRRGGNLPPVRGQDVCVLEESPPLGKEPLEWLLLTNLAVDDYQTAE